MRPFVFRLARQDGISGQVRNETGGVTIDAVGTGPAIEGFVARLRAERPAAARYDSFVVEPVEARSFDGFAIVESEAESIGPGRPGRAMSIPPDLATCPDCLREMSDPEDRRHRYPFTNCTSCGPRFTITRAVPYDRAFTTMAPFTMCRSCFREYSDPANRRFHAEPNACADCGPRVWLACSDGIPLEVPDPIAAAGAALASGKILALKGVGGFHLACDAGSSTAVSNLRRRKRREEKPLAVMVSDLPAAEELALLTPEERALLTSMERPVVLVRRRSDPAPSSPLAPEVAPDTSLLGLLLPYSPLHHLLAAAAGRPLVMTSGNLSNEPIAYRNDEALGRLGSIADLFLLHDREIEARADDSVARVVRGRTLVMRRSRGFVPLGVTVATPFSRPVLACGALLKNTFCLASEGTAYLGPHIGDLEDLETMDSFERSAARLEAFLGVAPRLLAHDLHPEYLSTGYALRRARAEGQELVAVQHHHAHVASCMAEHGIAGPVIGIAWDGAGLGTDGTAWGGEALVADYRGFERVATLRPLRLPGGDRAVRQPWRVALSLVLDAFGDAAPIASLPLFGLVPASDLETVRRMWVEGVNSPPAHGAGRWFDAVGALVLSRPAARYEGQVALALDAAAGGALEGVEPYPASLAPPGSPGSPAELDLRPTARAAVEDLLTGRQAREISGRFQAALAAGAEAMVKLAAARSGRLPVVLTGGVFQNARLAEEVVRRLAGRYEVYLHSHVPPGDGGIALGQAVIADALARGRSD